MMLWWPQPDRCWCVLFGGEEAEGAASPREACRRSRSSRAAAQLSLSLPHMRMVRSPPSRDLVTTTNKAHAFCGGRGHGIACAVRTDRVQQ